MTVPHREPVQHRLFDAGVGLPDTDDESPLDEPHFAETAELVPLPDRLPVRVVRSAKRRRTVHAQIVDGEIVVRVPARMSKADEARYVAELVERLEKRERRGAIDLDERTGALARRYDLPLPSSIRFVDNQQSRWGSCTIETREIRLSSRLAEYPPWVLDSVIVHELAHLVVPDHSPAFHALVDRYPKTERARGYLLAKVDGR